VPADVLLVSGPALSCCLLDTRYEVPKALFVDSSSGVQNNVSMIYEYRLSFIVYTLNVPSTSYRVSARIDCE
jgi:hypothetical protein